MALKDKTRKRYLAEIKRDRNCYHNIFREICSILLQEEEGEDLVLLDNIDFIECLLDNIRTHERRLERHESS